MSNNPIQINKVFVRYARLKVAGRRSNYSIFFLKNYIVFQ